MKKRILQTGALLFALTAIFLGFGTGCATTSGGGYQLKQTRSDISWAMVSYQNRVTAGFVTYEQRQQVTAAHNAYQKAFDEALRQANSDATAPTPDNVKQLANQLLAILSAL